jgi:hypothetical protein
LVESDASEGFPSADPLLAEVFGLGLQHLAQAAQLSRQPQTAQAVVSPALAAGLALQSEVNHGTGKGTRSKRRRRGSESSSNPQPHSSSSSSARASSSSGSTSRGGH